MWHCCMYAIEKKRRNSIWIAAKPLKETHTKQTYAPHTYVKMSEVKVEQL